MMTIKRDQLPDAALIVGCGDIGHRVAARLRAVGCEVTAITRSPPTTPRDASALRWLTVDLDHSPPPLCAPLVFWFAPPPSEGDADPRLRRWLAQAPRNVRVVYISTSGVYGDCQGRWIDEQEPLKPQTARGLRRLDAEQALRAAAGLGGLEPVILRVPGIYGPGRLPRARLMQGLPVLRAEESPYTNRIHADDLADAALHAAVYGRAGEAYHVADGNPTTMCDYFLRCAHALGLPAPPQIGLAEARQRFTPAMWSFMEESKRLRIDRLVQQLRFRPRYRDLEQGLRATLAAEAGTLSDASGSPEA